MDTEARISVDVGGTFIDMTLLTPEGHLVTAEVPNTDDQSISVVHGTERVYDDAGIDPAGVDAFTRVMIASVNVLLEDDGTMTTFVTTERFRDVLETGRQARPDLYNVTAGKPIPLVPRRCRLEVTERTTVEGIQTEVGESEVRTLTNDTHDVGAESIAVSLLYAYRHPENERVAAGVFYEELDASVSASHEVFAEFREFGRTSTTAVDAYVTSVIDGYLDRLELRAADLDAPVLQIMQANGGITPASTMYEHAMTTMMSGPVAGVVDAVETTTSPGGDLAGLVALDMGSIPSDVNLVRSGEVERTIDAEVSGRPIKTPVMDMNTVGAGGGSITQVDSSNALRVGPHSSGANLGPTCYGHGGTEPTVTDANAVLGYIGGSFALGGEFSFDVDAARGAFSGPTADARLNNAFAAARGVYHVTNANITQMIRAVTVEHGRNPRQFGLVALGSAGPMHTVTLVESFDIETVVVPQAYGVLLAYGLLAVDQKHNSVRTLRRPLSGPDTEAVESAYANLEADVLDDVTDPDDVAARRVTDLRYVGQSLELVVPVGETFDAEAVEARFHEAHGSTYGYRLDDPVELVNVRVTAVVKCDPLDVTYRGGGGTRKDIREAFFNGEFRETPAYDRDGLGARTIVEGPAILEQHKSTVVVPPVWGGTVEADGTLVLTNGGGDE